MQVRGSKALEIGLFPLKIQILHRRESALRLVTCRDRSRHVNSKITPSNDTHGGLVFLFSKVAIENLS